MVRAHRICLVSRSFVDTSQGSQLPDLEELRPCSAGPPSCSRLGTSQGSGSAGTANRFFLGEECYQKWLAGEVAEEE